MQASSFVRSMATHFSQGGQARHAALRSTDRTGPEADSRAGNEQKIEETSPPAGAPRPDSSAGADDASAEIGHEQ